MKKLITAILASAALLGSAFAEPSVELSNEIYEEDYFCGNNDGESEKDFPVIKNKIELEFTSDKVDAAITAIAGIDDFNDRNFAIDGFIDDWKIEWRPVESLALGLHDNIYANGSALPIYDDNLANGNIGSDGFTVTYTIPVMNGDLRFGATVPFNFTKDEDAFGNEPNWLKAKKVEDDEPTDDDMYLNFGLGAIFSSELFEAGFTAKDLTDSDSRLVGITASFPNLFGAVEGLTIGAGYANAKGKDAGFDDLISVLGTDFGVNGENLLNANVTFENDFVSVIAEGLFNVKNDESDYDLYSACIVGIPATEKLLINAGGKFLMDMNSDTKDDNKNIYSALIGTEYAINDNNSIGIEFDIFLRDKAKAFAVPVFWKWSM